jgi:hypothetical protein
LEATAGSVWSFAAFEITVPFGEATAPVLETMVPRMSNEPVLRSRHVTR